MRLIFDKQKKERTIKYQYEIIDCDEHVNKFLHAGTLEQRYRMTLDMLNNLIDQLREVLTVSFKHSLSSTSGNNPIYPEMIVAVSLRFLG